MTRWARLNVELARTCDRQMRIRISQSTAYTPSFADTHSTAMAFSRSRAAGAAGDLGDPVFASPNRVQAAGHGVKSSASWWRCQDRQPIVTGAASPL